MILYATLILGLHFNVILKFDTTMPIFCAFQIFAIQFYVNLLSSNWHSYVDLLLAHQCTLLTHKWIGAISQRGI